MDSTALNNLGFSAWHPFNRTNSTSLIADAPLLCGVYVIRRKTTFSRASGASDILYVGSAGNRNGLRMRLQHYFHPGPTQATNIRILARCGDTADYKISYVVCESSSVACELESEILGDYVAEHHELPPENRVLPRLPTNVMCGLKANVINRMQMSDRKKHVMTANSPNIAEVWKRIEVQAGKNFGLLRGSPFTYAVMHGCVRPDRTHHQIARSHFEMALKRVPLKNTAAVQDLRGPSFIYAILMDKRIRSDNW